MLSVVIPTLDAEATLVATLAALVPAVAEGLVREAIVADGGSMDATRDIVDAAGCRVISAERGRGAQLAAGAAAARWPWLLFLHADTVLEEGWRREAWSFIERADRQGGEAAASFAFALDDFGARARWLEAAVAARCKLLGLPYGDQGVLIHRELLQAVGGIRPLPLMEDVDLIRRLGRARLRALPTDAVTSAERWERDGYLRRSARNLVCLSLWFAGVPPRLIRRLYG